MKNTAFKTQVKATHILYQAVRRLAVLNEINMCCRSVTIDIIESYSPMSWYEITANQAYTRKYRQKQENTYKEQ
jgi:hypothetical protein